MRQVQVVVINVEETPDATRVHAERSAFTFPVLLDSDVSISCCGDHR
jgi:hypothetical protein